MGRVMIPNGSIFVTRHALQRLRVHYPTIGFRGARQMALEAEPMEQGLVAAILQRSLEAAQDHYRLSARGDGIFVLAPQETGWLLVTYLRLSEAQVRLLRG